MVLNFLKSSYQKVKSVFVKAGQLLGNKIRSLLKMGRLDEETLQNLEKLLYEADFGVETTHHLISKVRSAARENPQLNSEEVIALLKKEVLSFFNPQASKLTELAPAELPLVILVVGVNGNGKTTSVAKLAKRFQDADKKPLVAAADTFRAAAIEQLGIWAQRLNIDIVKGAPNSDPAAVAFDAVSAAKSRHLDVAIIDTAGRLHTKTNLMQELEKIRKTCRKLSPHAPHETLLVIDASTGQNAIDQAKTFHHHTPITGLILTKLDGTAKGGIVISIQRQLGIPVKFIGLGEGVDDLEVFDPENFVSTLFE